jgi:hypothetical protein
MFQGRIRGRGGQGVVTAAERGSGAVAEVNAVAAAAACCFVDEERWTVDHRVGAREG